MAASPIAPSVNRAFVALLVALAFIRAGVACADEPATGFFAIETARLAKLVQADTDLDKLSDRQLQEISIAHGWYGGGFAMQFSTGKFRVDARFTGHADIKSGGASGIGYHIDASTSQDDWNVLAVDGAAKKLGRQFVTDDWRSQRVTVILRFLNLKH